MIEPGTPNATHQPVEGGAPELQFTPDEGVTPEPPKGPKATETPSQKPLEFTPEEITPPGTNPPEDQPGATEPPAYTPNLNYKVKGQEKVFPDWIHDKIDSEDREKAIREMYEKYDGFDHVKADRDTLKQHVEWYQQNYEPAIQNLVALQETLKRGDMGAFFDGAGIDRQQVLRWAYEYSQLNPQQQQAQQAQSIQNWNNYYSTQNQNNEVMTLQTQLADARSREVDLILSRPDIAAFAQDLDNRLGRSGFLRDEIIRRGQAYAIQQKRDVPAEQVVQEVLVLAGYAPGNAQQFQPGNGQLPRQPGAGPAPRRNPPTLPTVKGGGGSPAKRQIRTREDLQKRRQELLAQGR